MKKFLLLSAGVITLSISMSSCIAKCQTCKKDGMDDVQICKEDFDGDRFKYYNAFQQAELQGYKCNNSK